MKEFTLVDYSAFALWILLSIGISYLLIRKLKILSIGLITGHLLYMIWKKFWLFIINYKYFLV
jgi:hypothetical protein